MSSSPDERAVRSTANRPSVAILLQESITPAIFRHPAAHILQNQGQELRQTLLEELERCSFPSPSVKLPLRFAPIWFDDVMMTMCNRTIPASNHSSQKWVNQGLVRGLVSTGLPLRNTLFPTNKKRRFRFFPQSPVLLFVKNRLPVCYAYAKRPSWHSETPITFHDPFSTGRFATNQWKALLALHRKMAL